MRDADRADRLRIAAVLLAPRDGEGSVRSPLTADEAMDQIRKMRSGERAHLTGLINWVREYEGKGEPHA